MSGLAVGGALAFLAFAWAGVKELFSGNPKGIVWGGLLIAAGFAALTYTGASESQAAQEVGRLVAIGFQVLGQVANAVASATGISPLIVYAVIGLLVFSTARGNGKKK